MATTAEGSELSCLGWDEVIRQQEQTKKTQFPRKHPRSPDQMKLYGVGWGYFAVKSQLIYRDPASLLSQIFLLLHITFTCFLYTTTSHLSHAMVEKCSDWLPLHAYECSQVA